MEIEVGEYVRTIYGEIFKVFRTTKQNKKYIFVDREVDRNQDRDANDNVLEIKEIKKHSKNIIDLIEAGDYVNGEKVIEVSQEPKYINFDTITIFDYMQEDIKSIVTKELYKEMEYRI